MSRDPTQPPNSAPFPVDASSDLRPGMGIQGKAEPLSSAETVSKSPPQGEDDEFAQDGGQSDIDRSANSVILGTEGVGTSSNESKAAADIVDSPPTQPSANGEAVVLPLVGKRGRGRPRKNPLAVPSPPARRVTRYAAPSDVVKKTTVSFYTTDQERVDYILDTLLETRRHRGGFSDAIKIALRLCPTDPVAIAQIWDEVRAGDKRTQRPKRK